MARGPGKFKVGEISPLENIKTWKVELCVPCTCQIGFRRLILRAHLRLASWTHSKELDSRPTYVVPVESFLDNKSHLGEDTYQVESLCSRVDAKKLISPKCSTNTGNRFAGRKPKGAVVAKIQNRFAEDLYREDQTNFHIKPVRAHHPEFDSHSHLRLLSS